MYSVVLLMALTGGSEAVDFGRHKAGCTGIVHGGCTGIVYSGCTGSCTGGCTGIVYGGCTGSCTGVTYSGCTGSCYGGCTGSCTGGHGHGLFSRLRHRHGCNGGCTGVVYGCNGGCTGVVYGCNGGCTGSCGGVIVTPVAPVTTTPPAKKVETKKMTQAVAPATIVVTLPADARLVIDGLATTSTSGQRTFVTPGLTVGSNYNYTLRAEIVRDGQTLVQTQQITVRGGETTAVPFSFNATGVASR